MDILEKKTMQLNPNLKVRKAIMNMVNNNNGYCPCNQKGVDKEDTKCPCKAYRKTNHCCCHLYTEINK